MALGFSIGLLTATIAVGGEILGWFNCISAWLIETVVFVLLLAVAVRPYRTVAVVPAVVVAYIGVISYFVISALHSGRWDPDDYLPVAVSFLLLVVLPMIFARGLDVAQHQMAVRNRQSLD
jgi:hypothetical protein